MFIVIISVGREKWGNSLVNAEKPTKKIAKRINRYLGDQQGLAPALVVVLDRIHPLWGDGSES